VTEPHAPAVLAIDGGRTKTDAVVVAADGSLLSRARGGPSNHQLVGYDGAIEALDEVIYFATRDAGIDLADPPYVPLGVYCLAGLDLPVDDAHLAPAVALRNWTGRDILRNDTFAVARAGTTSSAGIGLVCGTGLNCVGVGPTGDIVRFPALDLLSGDFAHGGSWLGVRALGLAQRDTDGRGAATTLTAEVPAHFGLPDVEAVLTAVYTGEIPTHRLYELAEVLLDAAADGDPLSRQAADYLADETARFATAAITRLDLQATPVEVVLGGGIFRTRDAAFHRRVTDGILAVAPQANLITLTAPPVLGAALLGLDALGTDDAAKDRLRRELR
jgi:N-acetylglucosamine kinase-like BadF-type ATPase